MYANKTKPAQNIMIEPFNHKPSILFFRLSSIIAYNFENMPLSSHKKLGDICNAAFQSRLKLNAYRNSVVEKRKTNVYSNLVRRKNLGDICKTPFRNPFSLILYKIACDIDKQLERLKIKKLTREYVLLNSACVEFYLKVNTLVSDAVGINVEAFSPSIIGIDGCQNFKNSQSKRAGVRNV